MTIVLGSILILPNQSQTIPTNAAKIITNNEFAELLTPLGSSGIPSTVLFKLLAANRLKDPPLCSKNAQKKMEKMIKTKAAINFLFSDNEKFRIS